MDNPDNLRGQTMDKIIAYLGVLLVLVFGAACTIYVIFGFKIWMVVVGVIALMFFVAVRLFLKEG
jgi:hypothetical protein